MGEGHSVAGSRDDRPVAYAAWAVLLMIVMLVFSVDARAMDVEEMALRERLPAAMKVSTPEARSRIRHWQTFVQSLRGVSTAGKLSAVNHYFNSLLFIEDATLWRRADYWATPLQVVAAGAGDCEDIAIAKYFTLKTLGIGDDHLRIAYVWNFNTPSAQPEAHMVLTYLSTAESEPLILDILTNTIQTRMQRPDLEMVYSVNAQGLWFSDDNSHQVLAGSPAQLAQWRQLSQAMASDAVLLRVK